MLPHSDRGGHTMLPHSDSEESADGSLARTEGDAAPSLLGESVPDRVPRVVFALSALDRV